MRACLATKEEVARSHRWVHGGLAAQPHKGHALRHQLHEDVVHGAAGERGEGQGGAETVR